MTRSIQTLFVALALVVAVAPAALWVRTCSCSDWVQFDRGNWGFEVHTKSGAVKWEWRSRNFHSPGSWFFEVGPPYRTDGQWVGTKWSALGFARGSSGGTDIMGGLGPMVVKTQFVVTPLWALCLLTWTFAAFSVAPAWRRRRRLRAGRCAACGYDLRATPGRCPECGREQRHASGGLIARS